MSSIYDVTTWELLVQLVRAGNGADGPASGHVSPGGWSVPGPHRDWRPSARLSSACSVP
ncbi:hypothetical protein [Plantactinospora alkalitolerans]|uniref:hypothetical protein n=1 Tax=Plantactinospora alkalitolerans TaxID=2789879 RepID=UPI001E357F6D|nr:hypothetical protein [Plantactinospora alkalitolerans]